MTTTGRMLTIALALGLPLAAGGCNDSPEANGANVPGEEDAMTQPEVEGPRVLLETSRGNILLGFYPAQAPLTVENFLAYVEGGHYDGLIFHRVIADFMIQGGGFEPDMSMREPGRPPIRNESDNGLTNARGTISMARTNDPHSATAQFFINHTDNPFLDYGVEAPNRGEWGYAVFGEVLEGIEVVDEIAAVSTGMAGGMADVPVETVTILSARVMQP